VCGIALTEQPSLAVSDADHWSFALRLPESDDRFEVEVYGVPAPEPLASRWVQADRIRPNPMAHGQHTPPGSPRPRRRPLHQRQTGRTIRPIEHRTERRRTRLSTGLDNSSATDLGPATVDRVPPGLLGFEIGSPTLTRPAPTNSCCPSLTRSPGLGLAAASGALAWSP